MPQPDHQLTEFLNASAKLASDPARRWQLFLEQDALRELGFETCHQAWNSIFEDWDTANGPRPVWAPDEQRREKSNLSQWMEETGCGEVSELHRWSIENRSEFWETALEVLEIAFRTEPNAIFAPNPVRKSPDVLPGSKLNIVESCLQASADQIAVVSGRPDGSMEFHTYAELQTLANQVSNLLVEQGYVAGNRLAVILPMTFHSIAIYLGIIQAGMVVVSIAGQFCSSGNLQSIANLWSSSCFYL